MSTICNKQDYELVIGLEVHVQLKTETKLFCQDSTRFGEDPNRNTCPVCLGHPGVLPVLNQKAVELAIKLGLALGCTIPEWCKFDRKHYFYPDLPKGYQISQFDHPLCEHGTLELSSGQSVRILRAHLEEDAGKLVHGGSDGLSGSEYSLVDLNRAGTPLLEIVSEPDIRNAEDAKEYVMQLRNIVRYLDVCDGNLEEGSMRCDANVSIRPRGETTLGTKTEIKNMNSFRSIQQAIESEFARQVEVLESGGRIVQESRLWDEASETTRTMRSKEESHDYRYFPDPDLRPLHVSRDWVESLRKQLPELPQVRLKRFIEEYGLSEYDSHILVDTKDLGDMFQSAAANTSNYKALANWLMGDITAYLKSERLTLTDTQLNSNALAELVQLVDKGTLSSSMAKSLLVHLLKEGGSAKEQAEAQGMSQVTDDSALRPMVAQVIEANPKQVEQYKGGKTTVISFFVGQVMKASKGQANPARVNALLQEMLAE